MAFDYKQYFGDIVVAQNLVTKPEERTWQLAAPPMRALLRSLTVALNALSLMPPPLKRGKRAFWVGLWLSLNDMIRSPQERRRDRQPKRLRCLQVDD